MSPTENSRVWLYAITATDLPHKQVGLFGIDKQPIRWIVIDALQVAVSLELSNTKTPNGLEQSFLEYELLLSSLCASRDCLPIRFGTKMHVHEVQEYLRNQGSHFREQLERFSGCCELSVRWAVPIQMLDQPSGPGPTTVQKSIATESGTSYLVRRREESRIGRAAERLANEIGARLQELYPAAIRKVLSSSRMLDSKSISGAMQSSAESLVKDLSDFVVIEVALLVFKSDADRVAVLVQSHLVCFQEPTLISGPWPIYSFVGP